MSKIYFNNSTKDIGNYTTIFKGVKLHRNLYNHMNYINGVLLENNLTEATEHSMELIEPINLELPQNIPLIELRNFIANQFTDLSHKRYYSYKIFGLILENQVKQNYSQHYNIIEDHKLDYIYRIDFIYNNIGVSVKWSLKSIMSKIKSDLPYLLEAKKIYNLQDIHFITNNYKIYTLDTILRIAGLQT